MGRVGWVPALAATGMIVVGAASCSAVPNQTLDTVSLQQRIATWLASRYDLPAPAVSCPTRVSGRPGSHFDCTTAVAGSAITVTGTVSDSSGRFSITLNRAVIDAKKAGKALAAQLHAEGAVAPMVDCGPDRVRVVAPGGTITCTATSGGVTQTVTGVASGTSGEVAFSVLVPPVPGGAASPGSTTTTTAPESPPPDTAPSTTLPSSAPPSAIPPSAIPPSAIPPSATPPSATPPSAGQPSATAPTTTAPSTTVPGATGSSAPPSAPGPSAAAGTTPPTSAPSAATRPAPTEATGSTSTATATAAG
ncbi:DUF4333 domain-containing protein [Acidiferrimicrobium sp. IK]|uniref:DUF4333 domain-containing protein n=1 Tax=Acidiferrimicrobium sp. IK TaxID=2871700 RepID=UPI0021CB3658|nr:DUF4333 domain-containing protein [Acidiferrimicrobium sp. IK]